jgi:hypothetical protein
MLAGGASVGVLRDYCRMMFVHCTNKCTVEAVEAKRSCVLQMPQKWPRHQNGSTTKASVAMNARETGTEHFSAWLYVPRKRQLN